MFKAQGEFSPNESRYYEAIIFEDNVVPTREHSWHDLFNALIWLQFPKTKALLNTLHIDDIQEHGTHPRTPRRNRITHFDECGVVIATEEQHLKEANRLLAELANHNWMYVLYDNKSQFEAVFHTAIFGHANYEMLLSPFIGLTGKWLSVAVPNGFSSLCDAQKNAVLDDCLLKRIGGLDNFNQAQILKPVPLLGIPSWFNEQTRAFYANQQHFRPLRENAKPTTQLPLLE